MARGDSSERKDLEERRKELACLTGICGLFALRDRSLGEILALAAPLIASGWQYPDKVVVRIRLGGHSVSTGDRRPPEARLRRPIAAGARVLGAVEVAYPCAAARRAAKAFLPTERELLTAVAAVIGTMAELTNARDALARQAGELRLQRRGLTRKNIALREMLSQLELEKREMAERVQANVTKLVAPAVARLARPALAPEARRRLLLVAERHLAGITSTLGSTIRAVAPSLSPREIEVCDLVRTGLANKEIASTLGVSPLTVERHRHNIRRKLGLAGTTNLATYLSSLH